MWSAGIEVSPDSGFTVVDDGIPAIRFGVYTSGPGSNLLDLVAVTVGPPRRVLTLRGIGDLLGFDNFDHADITRATVRLYRSPLDWLAAGGDGISVCDWFKVRPLLCRLPGLICDDAAHADDVYQRLRGCGPMPRFYVEQGAAA